MPMSSVYISSAVLFSVSVYTVLLARLPSKTESMPNSAGGQPRGICHRIQTGDSVENPEKVDESGTASDCKHHQHLISMGIK